MWRLLLLASVYLVSASLPLAIPIGANLEYEYALLASLAVLVLLPLAAMVGKVAPVLTEMARPAIFTSWVLFSAPLVALLPGLLLFTFGGCPCSKNGYLFWMAVLWYPAQILAHALYLAGRKALSKGFTRRRLLLTLTLIYAIGLIIAAANLWLYPQKRLMSLLFGFLHGPIYDDWIAFDGGLFLARLSHLILALALLALALVAKGRWLAWATSLLLFAGAGSVHMLSLRFPSVHNSRTALDELLYGVVPGDGFTLHYRPVQPASSAAPSIFVPEPSAGEAPQSLPLEIRRLHRDAQFHVDELRKVFAAASLPTVAIYVYPSEDKKKLWFGGGSTDVADVVTPSIHITQGAWPHPTLRHELVHALASDIAFFGLGFHPNMAFTEGLAVALAPQPSALSLDDGAASVLKSGRLGDLATLFTPAFWQHEGGRAYTVAGSFINYLIREQGIKPVLALYAGSSFHEAFKQDQASLVAAFKQYLLDNYDEAKNGLYAEALFRSPGLFAEDCPHTKSDLARPRDEGPFVRMRQPPGWDVEQNYLPWLISLDAKDQEARVRLWRRETKKAASERLPSRGRLATWIETVRQARRFPPETLEDVELAIIESDLARAHGDRHTSIALLRDLAAASKNKYFGESLWRETIARLSLEEALPHERALEWRSYLAGYGKKIPDNYKDLWLTTYLKLRADRQHQLPLNEVLSYLEAAPDAAFTGSFPSEWYRLIAARLMRDERYQEAATAFAKAVQAAPVGHRAALEQEVRRARYYEAKGRLSSGRPSRRQGAL